MTFKLPERQLLSQDDASMIARPDVPRSKFTGQFSRKFTFDAGYLIPFHVEECLPGGHYRFQITPFIRTATPLFPIMDSQRFDVHAFFVPNRLVWQNWVKLMGQQDSPGDSIAFTVPQVTSTGNGFAVGSVMDYMGLPTIGQCAAVLSVNALPIRAWRLIYHQWYRDENLINGTFPNTGDTSNTEAQYGALFRRAKSHDYFTSCLPWPQKFVAPSVPLVGNAPITGIGLDPGDRAGTASGVNFIETGGATQAYAFMRKMDTTAVYAKVTAAANAEPEIYADLSAVSGVSINDFRLAMQIQVFLERMARGGTRYTEILETIWGVRNPDARLQRAEYIGGGSTPVQFTPIAQTGPTSGTAYLGNLAAAGTAVGNNVATYAATEHGFIIIVGSVKSELSYSQGIHKMWDRRTLYDYPNPAFVGLGEQAVLRREIYATGVPANDDVVFGYQERYHEYRTEVSRLAALFRPTAAGNIDEWHLSQQFSGAPTLGQTFIEDTPPMTRVYAAGALANGIQYLADVHIRREATLPLPMFGTPVGLGRF